MIKEELEKEVEEKSEAYIDSINIYDDVGASAKDVLDAYKQGALDFAEPRERRIFELINKLSHAKEVIRRLLEEERNNIFWVMNGADRPKWHKVADGDLPTDEAYVIIYTDLNNYYVAKKVKNHFMSKSWGFIPMSTVIAWCKIPKYTEE